jgi:hypothetical protein
MRRVLEAAAGNNCSSSSHQPTPRLFMVDAEEDISATVPARFWWANYPFKYLKFTKGIN